MTDRADGDPAWLRDFPWLGGIAPQWVQQQREHWLRRQEEERMLREKQRRLMQQWAEYDAQQHAVLQGHVDVTATGRHVAIADPNALARDAASPAASGRALDQGTNSVTSTGTHRTVSSTGTHRAVTSTGTHRAVTSTGTHRAVGSDAVSSTGTHRAIPRQGRADTQTGTLGPQRDGYVAPPDRFAIPERPGLPQVWVDPARAWTYARPALSRHALAGVLVLLAFAGGAEVIFLWWLQTPASRLQHLADEYIMGAQLTGLLGAYLLLIEVALMARIPWLERRIGSWLATLHRGLGAYLIMLLAAHTALVIVGYSMSLQAPASVVVKSIFATYPYVLMATGGFALLIAIGVSSIKHFRQKLGYDRWHSLHLVAYPAAVMAFFHQVFLGAQFTRNQVAKDTWIAMHVVVAAAIVLYRVYVPLNRTLKYRLRVVGVVVESADTISIYVGGVNVDRLGAQAGQYFRWRFLGRGLWHQTHPFSLSAAPTNGVLRLTVKGVGNYTRRLKRRIRPGVRVVADGPYGAFTAELRRRQRVLLIGGGVGVTPLRAIAEALDGGPGDVMFLQRASSAADLLMVDELEKMDAEGRLMYVPVLGKRGKTPRQDPMAPHRLREIVGDLDEREVFICGSPSMARSTIKNLRKAGVPWRRIHTELFDF
ncbi:ferric reductase-like transmembrane domain-containing protein [Actinocrinis puniceicyclus]|uniref:Ferric reductase-like transmembrane domain-containing protein n=1 Tax=Actinocrinis puniceicyclus TaxID=977794 RepID=A0A8J8BBP2_9ACTN|nr:ferredoxin reductase family protein [Actinocrinis puniceicyclus]MBS2963323.1 ferric reductase-like transmembrane domain-containing protein [Actinocrinis puniceicyclus]